jgi:putative transposase
MPRMPRGIELDQDGQYHLRAQAAGPKGYYPLQEKENAEQLIAFIRQFTGLYFCVVAALEVLGSHYHLCCRFLAFRKLSQDELQGLAERFYPGPYCPYLTWGPAEWARFNRRLFNVSELMRNIQQAFTRWFNQRHHRKGPFWAGRFASTESDSLLETVYYVELNAVRAALVRLPEQWRYSSVWMRKNHQDGWLLPLVTLLETADPEEAEGLYWASLYWTGTEPSKETDALIPAAVAEQMEQRQLARGCYLKRQDAFSRGRKIGSREAILASLQRCRDKGIYRRRRHPIPCRVGGLFALRESRRSYVRL